MAVGVTQPGGAGTIIYIYDDLSSASGTGYTPAEISAAFPVDVVPGGTLEPSYRFLVDLQIGDVGAGTATTTLVAKNLTCSWDNTRTLRWRATQTSSWFWTMGTKVGSGNTASGKDGATFIFGAATSPQGSVLLYGSTIKTRVGAFQINGTTSGVTKEIVNCIIQSEVAGIAPIAFGAASLLFDNMYNVDISHSTGSQVLSAMIATAAERVTISAATPSTFLLTSLAVPVLAKDLRLFGTPTLSDLRFSAVGAINWQLIRPIFSGNAPKFSTASAGNPTLTSATWEYWLYDVKVVDGVTGLGISGIPVKVTDAIGNVQVDTTTDANGQISFGSGLTANAVIVMDHYMVASTYTQRHRSPFLFEFNTGAGRNNNYAQRRYYANWPGKESVTTSGGTFEDVGDIVALQDASGLPTGWAELSM